MSIKRFKDITIGELLEIKKILKMSIKEALPKMRELRDNHDFTDTETKNLIGLARDFKTTMMIKI